MNQTTRDLGVTISVRPGIVMWHTCLCVAQGGEPAAVVITTDPLAHDHLAQVVMHKTRSHGCAVQVARYVRRRFGIEEPVTTHRAARPREAMIGYACTRAAQHPPSSYGEDVFEVVKHIADTPISVLLSEVAGGHSTARTRYVVYEVRGAPLPPRRGITHRFTALERRYREAPPDATPFSEVVQVGRHASREEAERQLVGFQPAGDHLWTRKPAPAYVARVLRIDANGDIVWTCDGTSAVREYDFRAVVIGPHVYTEYQIRHVLERGAWPPNGNSTEGRRLMAQTGR